MSQVPEFPYDCPLPEESEWLKTRIFHPCDFIVSMNQLADTKNATHTQRIIGFWLLASLSVPRLMQILCETCTGSGCAGPAT